MLQALHNLERVDSYNQETFSIENIVVIFGYRFKKMPEGVDKKKGNKYWSLLVRFLTFV